MHIWNDPSFFLTNKTGAPQGEELGLIKPLLDSSCSCSENSFISEGANQYGARATGAAPGIKSIWNSTCRVGGRPDNSLGNTSGKSQTIDKSRFPGCSRHHRQLRFHFPMEYERSFQHSQ
ncbi:hypothetical protein Tco_0193522 [Tanacetum coccineum]